ncbi:MAG TPA: class I SAM-dependent methyltransferase [Pyrinomonadaceae bacterium]|nr:class I SAM-dependent methyltransferase [Pyrinomonadaceae bacterium]
MAKDHYQFKHEREREHALQSMRAYLRNKPEQVKFFEEIAGPYLKDDVSVLDACCGIGDLIYFLTQLNPNARFTGVDKAEFLIDEARTHFAGNPNVTFERGDIYALSDQFDKNSFDLSVCKQTLSWLPSYEEPVKQLMAVTRRAIFISSLFYDGRIDFETRVREHTTDTGRDGYNAFYNVYSFPIFKEFCLSHGAKDVVGFDFNIRLDLPKPANPDRMGTYTVQLQSGERLQISGALLMPWKIVRIDL